jgi:predicted small lipoprotein YifL
MRHLMLCFAAVLPLAMTAACGQKGPLYLPPRNGTVVTRPPQTTNQPAQDDKDEKKDNSQTPPK